MKGNRKIKCVSSILIMCLLVSLLSGCNIGGYEVSESKSSEAVEGTDETRNDETNPESAETIPEVESQDRWGAFTKMELTGELADLTIKMAASDGQGLYLYGTKSKGTVENNAYHDHFILYCDEEGNVQTVYSFEEIIALRDLSRTFSFGFWSKIVEMVVTADGNLLVLFRGTQEDMGEYRMVKFSRSGGELWQTVIGCNNFITPSLVCTDENIYFHDGKQIVIYDQNGVLQKQVVPGELLLLEIDLKTGEFGEYQMVSVDGGEDPDIFEGQNSGYDMLLNNSKGLYGLKIGEAPAELANWEDAGIDFSSIDSLTVTRDGDIMISYLHMLLKANVNETTDTEKQTITIATSASAASNVKEWVLEFNRMNTKWSVEVVSYEFYDESVLKQFNLDLVNGNRPDILLLDHSMLSLVPYENYGNQGMFEDLKGWFEQDPELKESDYLTNVFDALGKDGRWNRVCTEFGVKTWFGKTSILGEVDRITLSDVIALGEEYSCIAAMTARKEANIRNALVTRWDQFVNESDGSCNFDSEAFVQVLESLKDYPGEGDPIKYDPQNMRNDDLLLMGAELDSFRKWIEYPAEWFGEDCTVVGYPDASGNGGMIVPRGSTISMFADSDCKEGAWAFIRYFFTDAYQSDIGIEGANDVAFRVKKSALEKQLEAALDPVWSSYGYMYEDIYYEVPIPSRQEMEAWVDYISNITCAELVDVEVYNIIIEEAGAFFAGQKTAEDVAKIIQSRVWIYLAEQQ